MKIVIDTNIVFSGILNSGGKIGRLLLTSGGHFTFYSCEFLRFELLKHKQRLLKITGLSEDELIELQNLVTQNITFINEGLLSETNIISAEELVRNIDPNDAPFIALTEHLQALLWTGDKELINGLKIKNYQKIINTSELFLLFEELNR